MHRVLVRASVGCTGPSRFGFLTPRSGEIKIEGRGSGTVSAFMEDSREFPVEGRESGIG